MMSVKLAVGCFSGCFAAAIGFGMTHDWLKRKSHKVTSGEKDIPEKEIHYESNQKSDPEA